MEESIEVFLSYAHRDKALLDRLLEQLALLKRQKLIGIWHDSEISAGADWRQAITLHLNTAHLILLLISPAFIASEYCYSQGMTRAVERHDAGEARVIPIILRPVDWHDAPFGKLQALPPDGKPVTSWSNRDAAFLAITQGIRTSVEELRGDLQGKGSASIPIDRTLLAILNLQKDWCRQKNVPFHTPILLLVLLEMANGVARRALETLRSGLAAELERRLKSYVAAVPTSGAGSSFSDFLWEERADVRLAQRRAMEEGSATVTERHLFLGILETKSNTQQGLKDMLGEDDFLSLIQIVRDTAIEPLDSNGPTPWIRDLLQRDLLQ